MESIICVRGRKSYSQFTYWTKIWPEVRFTYDLSRLAGRPDILAIDGIVPSRGATARLHDPRRRHEDDAAHAGAAALAEDANPAREAAGQAREPGGHVRSARPRRLGSATRHVALFDDRVRPADRGAARPPRARRGRCRRHLARRQHHSRGRLTRAAATARHGDRDARARQRDPRLRGGVRAPAADADLRRATDARARFSGRTRTE